MKFPRFGKREKTAEELELELRKIRHSRDKVRGTVVAVIPDDEWNPINGGQPVVIEMHTNVQPDKKLLQKLDEAEVKLLRRIALRRSLEANDPESKIPTNRPPCREDDDTLEFDLET